MDLLAQGGDGGLRVRRQVGGHLVDERRRHQRLVALDVDHDGIVGQAQPASATSARRSVPELCSARVSTTWAPNPWQASRMRSSSVATTTRLAALLRAWFQTRWIIGWPAISCNGLPGRRVEA